MYALRVVDCNCGETFGIPKRTPFKCDRFARGIARFGRLDAGRDLTLRITSVSWFDTDERAEFGYLNKISFLLFLRENFKDIHQHTLESRSRDTELKIGCSGESSGFVIFLALVFD